MVGAITTVKKNIVIKPMPVKLTVKKPVEYIPPTNTNQYSYFQNIKNTKPDYSTFQNIKNTPVDENGNPLVTKNVKTETNNDVLKSGGSNTIFPILALVGLTALVYKNSNKRKKR